jgi:hypothetical protein
LTGSVAVGPATVKEVKEHFAVLTEALCRIAEAWVVESPP